MPFRSARKRSEECFRFFNVRGFSVYEIERRSSNKDTIGVFIEERMRSIAHREAGAQVAKKHRLDPVALMDKHGSAQSKVSYLLIISADKNSVCYGVLEKHVVVFSPFSQARCIYLSAEHHIDIPVGVSVRKPECQIRIHAMQTCDPCHPCSGYH
jgi:hypothetical protein